MVIFVPLPLCLQEKSDHVSNGEVEISPGVSSGSCKPVEVGNQKIVDVESLKLEDVKLDVES